MHRERRSGSGVDQSFQHVLDEGDGQGRSKDVRLLRLLRVLICRRRYHITHEIIMSVASDWVYTEDNPEVEENYRRISCHGQNHQLWTTGGRGKGGKLCIAQWIRRQGCVKYGITLRRPISHSKSRKKKGR